MDQLREISEATVLAEALAAEVAVVYKHSHRCPVSLYTINEVREFADERPDIPVYLLNVVRNADMSSALADDVGVPHRSPQVILLRSGKPEAHASHHDITCELLESWVRDLSPHPPG